MSDALGMSVGTTNLVAAGVGHAPVIRRAVVTLFGHAPPQVGAPPADPGGLTLSGFVERVGDPVPLVATDGSSYPAEQLLVEALETMAGLAVPAEPGDVTIAVPSYWPASTTAALQTALGASALLSPGGTAPRLISDVDATLTSLNANPGLHRGGVVALIDAGGSGTSISLVDAASAFAPIGQTYRFADLAGDQIDQDLLALVLDKAGAGDDEQTAAVPALARLRDDCRAAKERLSSQIATSVTVETAGQRTEVEISRAELERLIAPALAGLFGALDTAMARAGIAEDQLSSIVLAGGGAAIPMLTGEFTRRSRAVVTTTPRPGLDGAVGAALFAAYGRGADTATMMAPVAMGNTQAVPSAAGSTEALAWSQDDPTADAVVPYEGPTSYEDPYGETETDRAANPYYAPHLHEPAPADQDVNPWQRLPLTLIGTVAVIALVAVGGVAVALTSVDSSGDDPPKPGNNPLSRELPPQQTVTVTDQPPPPAPSSAVPAPPPPAETTQPPAPAPTTTTAATTTTTTTTTTATTTTTTTTTTTVPTTTTTVPTTTTTVPTTTVPTTAPTTAPPTTAPPTTAPTAPAITTTYLDVPFLPDIPILVPNNS